MSWTSAAGSDITRVTGDPLGLRAWANRVAKDLVPGLTNRNFRVQGYGLLCAGLSMTSWPSAVARFGADEAWLRFERLWVLAQTQALDEHPNVSSWPGRRIARRLLDDHPEGSSPLDFDVPLLGRQLTSGMWGAYRRSAGQLGLIRGRLGTRATAPASTMLTPAGNDVAGAWFAENLQPGRTAGQLKNLAMYGAPKRAALGTVLRPDLPPYQGLSAALTKGALLTLDKEHGLVALRKVWDEEGSLSATSLRRHRSLLTDSQRVVLPQAQAVQTLVRVLERPYRSFLVSGEDKGCGNVIWRSPAWSEADMYAPELHGLRQRGAATPDSWMGTHKFAKRLADIRGGRAVAANEAPAGYEKALVPAMSLLAAESLFAHGFLGAAADIGKATSAALKARNADESDEAR